jgi:REP element-mobilizing transposase RayT
MHFDTGNLYHIFNQGNNRNQVYIDYEDYYYFLRLIRKDLLPVSELLAYSLMPNHFHLMICTDERCKTMKRQGGIFIDPVTNGIRKILSRYARSVNDKYGFSGSVFRQKTKAKCLSEMQNKAVDPYYKQDYYFNCFNYIHQNPLKAGLVDSLEDWQFSSYLDYAGLRNGTLCNKELASLYCSYKKDSFIQICSDLSCLNYHF